MAALRNNHTRTTTRTMYDKVYDDLMKLEETELAAEAASEAAAEVESRRDSIMHHHQQQQFPMHIGSVQATVNATSTESSLYNNVLSAIDTTVFVLQSIIGTLFVYSVTYVLWNSFTYNLQHQQPHQSKTESSSIDLSLLVMFCHGITRVVVCLGMYHLVTVSYSYNNNIGSKDLRTNEPIETSTIHSSNTMTTSLENMDDTEKIRVHEYYQKLLMKQEQKILKSTMKKRIIEDMEKIRARQYYDNLLLLKEEQKMSKTTTTTGSLFENTEKFHARQYYDKLLLKKEQKKHKTAH